MSPVTTVKTAGNVAMAASNMLSRANTLVNTGYGEDLQNDYTDMQSSSTDLGISYTNMQNDYTDKQNDYTNDPRSGYTDLGTSYSDSKNDYTTIKNSLVNVARKLTDPLAKLQKEYINKETGVLNKGGQKYLNRLHANNEEFRYEIINFVRDKKELDLEKILDGRCKTNTVNMDGNKYSTELYHV